MYRVLQTNATKQQDHFNLFVAPHEQRLYSARRTKRLIERHFDRGLEDLTIDIENRMSTALEQADNFTLLRSETTKDWREHHETVQRSNEKQLR